MDDNNGRKKVTIGPDEHVRIDLPDGSVITVQTAGRRADVVVSAPRDIPVARRAGIP